MNLLRRLALLLVVSLALVGAAAAPAGASSQPRPHVAKAHDHRVGDHLVIRGAHIEAGDLAVAWQGSWAKGYPPVSATRKPRAYFGPHLAVFGGLPAGRWHVLVFNGNAISNIVTVVVEK